MLPLPVTCPATRRLFEEKTFEFQKRTLRRRSDDASISDEVPRTTVNDAPDDGQTTVGS